MCKVLIVDDEESVRAAVQRRLRREGLKVDTADGEVAAMALIAEADPAYDVVLTDMVMENPDSGVNVLKAAVARDVFTEVVVLTAYGNVANAVECMKHGAFDYVQKNAPGVDVHDKVSEKVGQALERRRASLGTIRRMDWFSKITGSQTP